MKGIVLAGGRATRLSPATDVVSKQLLPVYDKPMIYYPISTLMMAGCREILIITTPNDVANFKRLLGGGERLGVKLEYAVQMHPNGIAEALLIGEKFVGDAKTVWLILGDNLFLGNTLPRMLDRAAEKSAVSTIFVLDVGEEDARRYGALGSNSEGRHFIVEKPSGGYALAVAGLYCYTPASEAIKAARECVKSARGELEITDVNNVLLAKSACWVQELERGFPWFDCGEPDALLAASQYVQAVQKRTNIMLGCIEETALLEGFITGSELAKSADGLHGAYKEYVALLSEDAIRFEAASLCILT